MKKIILCKVFYMIGFVMYVIGLSQLNKISESAGFFGLVVTFGIGIFTISIFVEDSLKKDIR